MFTKEQLIEQIREMGVKSTDTVVIHTSMRAIGDVDGGADTVIDAFGDVLSDGLLVVPTHTWAVVTPKQPFYDVRTSVPNIGALPCAAAKRTDGVRSLHPTHSMWVKGKHAAAFVSGEEHAATPTPPGFAWARLGDVGAKILLLGVGNDKNTFIHTVDELYDIPDRLSSEPYTVTIRDYDGNETSHAYHGHHCSRTWDVSKQFVNFEPAFLACGVQTMGQLGNAVVRIVDAKKCRDTVLKIFKSADADPTLVDKDLCVEYLDIPASYYL